MSGWVTPPSAGGPGPVVGWVQPDEPPGLGVGESIRAGWGHTRAHLGPLVVITAVPVVLLSLLTIPIWVMVGQMFDAMLSLLANYDWSTYRSDPGAFDRAMQSAFQPSGELSLIVAVSGGLTFIIWIVGTAALTAALLEATSGRRPSVSGAYRAVAAHPGALLVPAIVIGLGYAAIAGPLTQSQNDLMFSGAASTRAAVGLTLSLVILALEVIALYFAIRWSLYFQAVLADDLGLRQALARSSQLTAGVRIKIALILLVVSIVVGILMGTVIMIVGLVAGLVTFSIIAGVAAASITVAICALLYLPFFVAVLTHIYRRRVETLGGDAVEPVASA
jgi:hypothetical protein